MLLKAHSTHLIDLFISIFVGSTIGMRINQVETAGVWVTQLSMRMNGMIFNASIILDQNYVFLIFVKVSNSSFLLLQFFCIFCYLSY